MFLPITIDLPPTGTNRIEYDLQQISSHDSSEELFLFNSTDYVHTKTFSGDIARQDLIRQFLRRYDQLMVRFKKNWQNGQEAFAGISKNEVFKTSGLLSAFILSTNPDKVAVEVTPEATVFFTVIYMEENAYVEAHFAPDEKPEIVFNIYRNGAPVLAYGGEFAPAIDQYIQYFAKK